MSVLRAQRSQRSKAKFQTWPSHFTALHSLNVLGAAPDLYGSWKSAGASAARELGRSNQKEKTAMLTTIAILLLVLWALGLVTATTLGGYIHVLLIAAIAMILIRIIEGRRIM